MTLMLGYYYFDIKILSRIKRKKNMEDRSMSFTVRGMTCMHCAGNVKKAAESVLGVIDVHVDLEDAVGSVVDDDIDDRDLVVRRSPKRLDRIQGRAVP